MRLAIASLLTAAAGCDDLPPRRPPPIGAETFSPGGAVAPSGAVEPGSTGSATTTGPGNATDPSASASASATDASATDVTFATGGITECRSACDCPPLTRCTSNGCEPSARQVWCCGEPTCPSGQACEGPGGLEGICP